MPTYESLIPRLQQQDNGLAVLVALVAIGSIGIIAYQRRKQPQPLRLPLPSLFVILVIALGLRLPLMRESLWYDEAFTARIATLPFEALPNAISADVHPPGYYLLMWIWSHLVGTSAVALRWPSLVFGILSVYLVYRLLLAHGRPDDEARLAALLLALLPAAVYYSGEARSYALLLCLVLGALISIARGREWVFVLLTAFVPWVHNLGIVYAAALAAGAVLQRRWWIPSSWAVLIGATWLPVAFVQSSTIADGYWTYITPAHVLWPLVTMTVGTVGRPLQVLLAWIPILASVFVAGAMWVRHWRRETHLAVTALILGVPAAIAFASFVWQPIYVPRVVFVSMVLLVVPLAFAVRRSRLLLMLTALALVSGLVVRYVDQVDARVDYRTMAAVWCEGADYIYTTSIPAAFIFSANSDLPVLAWSGSEDDAGTFVPADLPLFGFATSDQPLAGDVCIPQIDTPMHAQRERDYVAALLETHPQLVLAQAYEVDEYHKLYFYRIGVQ